MQVSDTSESVSLLSGRWLAGEAAHGKSHLLS